MDAIKTEQPFRWYYTEIDPRGVETYYKLCSDEAEVKALVARFGGTYFPLYLAQPALAQPAQPSAEVLAAMREVLRISDRKHEAWDIVREYIKETTWDTTRSMTNSQTVGNAAPQPAPVKERSTADAPTREDGDGSTVPGSSSATISTDGAGAREGNERGHCAEGAPVRLPDKGSAAGSEAASDGCNPAPSTLSTDGGHRGLSDALRKGSGEKLSSWDRRSMSPPSTDAFEQECADIDAILGELGLDPERMRSEGGRLILSRIFEAIRAGRATVALPNLPTAQMIEAGIAQAFPHLTGIQPGDIVRIWQSMVIAARGKL